MTRTSHIVKELGRNLRRNPGTALGSLLSLTLLFLLFDIFWVAAGTSDAFYRDLLSDLTMDVYVEESHPDSLLGLLSNSIKGVQGVRDVEYLSKDEAREELARLVGTDLLVGYDSLNPLPRSFVLDFEPDYLNLADIAGIGKEIADFPGTAEVAYSRVWLQKAEETKAVILQLGLGLGILILLTALISSSNNIRLMTRARAAGFRQMLLLGASRMFIGLPLIIEGFLLGAVSSALGWWVVYYGHARVSFAQIEIILPLPTEMVLFCLAAAALGAFSGYVGVRGALKGWR